MSEDIDRMIEQTADRIRELEVCAGDPLAEAQIAFLTLQLAELQAIRDRGGPGESGVG